MKIFISPYCFLANMSKRGVHFAEKNIEEMQTDGPSSGRLKAHSLDSDEENDEGEDGRTFDDRNILREEDLEGQEEATIDFDEGIKITPFNLKEEMEEGYFDAEGNYFERKEEVIRDEWLDSLDWIKIKQQGGKMKTTAGRDDKDDSDFEDAEEPADEINCIKEILEIVLPGETVLKALRRLGGKDGGRGKSSSASARWQPKAKKVKVNQTSDDGATEEDKQRLLKLTELADSLLQRGKFSIYQDTYEKLVIKVKNMEKVKQEADEDDALEAAFRQGRVEEEEAPTMPQAEISEKEAEDEVHWQYKWENTTSAPVYGPYSSTYMLIWEQQGCFGDGVWVKRVGEEGGPFYNSRRIDFELYT